MYGSKSVFFLFSFLLFFTKYALQLAYASNIFYLSCMCTVIVLFAFIFVKHIWTNTNHKQVAICTVVACLLIVFSLLFAYGFISMKHTWNNMSHRQTHSNASHTCVFMLIHVRVYSFLSLLFPSLSLLSFNIHAHVICVKRYDMSDATLALSTAFARTNGFESAFLYYWRGLKSKQSVTI